MTNKNKKLTPITAQAEDVRSWDERIVKVSDGVYVLKPRNVKSKALPVGPFKGTCKETQQTFVYYGTQRKGQDGVWRDPVLDIHPDLLKARLMKREQIMAALPSEILSAWQD